MHFAEKHRPVGMRLLSVRGTWGASRTLLIEHGAVGAARSAGLFQPAGSLLKRILDVKLSALFLAALVENPGEVLPDRLTRFRRELLGKHPQFLVLVGGGVERLARLRRRQGIDIGR
jgi:hypothetical protein